MNRGANNSGQALAEYVLALSIVTITIVGIGTMWRYWSNTSIQSDGTGLQMFTRAPHTISSSEGGSGQWVKDMLMH